MTPTPTQSARPPRAPAGRGRTFLHGALGGLGYAVGMLCMYRESVPALGLVMWIAVAALTLLALKTRRPFMLALGVYVGAIPGTLLTHEYMIGVALAGYILFPLFISFWVAAYAWTIARLAAGPWPWLLMPMAPFIWVGLEYLRGECVMGGYPWYMLAHVHAPSSDHSAPAMFAGAYAASLRIAMVSLFPMFVLWIVANPGRLKQRTRTRCLFGALAALLFVLLLSVNVIPSSIANPPAFSDRRTLRIACIQTNMSRDDKNARKIEGLYTHSQRWYELSRQAAAAGAELIVWPETMYSGYGLDDGTVAELRRSGLFYPSKMQGGPANIFLSSFYEDLMALQREINVPMLIGAVAYDNFRAGPPPGGGPISITFDRRYNSLFMVQNGLVDPRRYDKRRLVPFGEFMPLVRYIPGATKWIADMVGSKVPVDCTEGDHLRTFEVTGAKSGGPVRIITPICFEAVYSSTVRDMAYVDGRRAADLIVNISNDNWFGEGTRDRYAHMVNAAWRSVELGLPTVRSVNTGISCVIDASGKVVYAKVLPSGSVKVPLPNSPPSPVGTASDNVLTEGVLIYDVPIPDSTWEGTISMRIGDVVPITCTVVTGLCVLVAVFGARKSPDRAGPAAGPPQETKR